MDCPLCNELADYSDHLQRKVSQRMVPITKDWPVQMTQIICKNKVLSLTILFAGPNSSRSRSFEKTKLGTRPSYLQRCEKIPNFITESRSDLFSTSWPICKNQTLYWTILFIAKIWLNKMSSRSHGPSSLQLAGPSLYLNHFKQLSTPTIHFANQCCQAKLSS